MIVEVSQRIAQLVVAYADLAIRTNGLNGAEDALMVAKIFNECSKTPDEPEKEVMEGRT